MPAQQVQGAVQLTDAQKLEILIKQPETCSSLHQKYECGFKANATALTLLQAIAGGTVAILSTISASKEDLPNVLNILSAVSGAVSAGLSGSSKWRDYAGKATFRNNAVLFYDRGANQADNTMQASERSLNYPSV